MLDYFELKKSERLKTAAQAFFKAFVKKGQFP